MAKRNDPPAVLWHGTGCIRAARIIAEDHLRHWAWDGKGGGVSLTSQRDFAEYFSARVDAEDAARADHVARFGPDADFQYDSGVAEAAFPHLAGVVLEFETDLLPGRETLGKVAYTGDWDDEAEWRLPGADGIEGVAGTLRAIHVDEGSVRWWMARCPPDDAAALARLLAHPAMRPTGDPTPPCPGP